MSEEKKKKEARKKKHTTNNSLLLLFSTCALRRGWKRCCSGVSIHSLGLGKRLYAKQRDFQPVFCGSRSAARHGKKLFGREDRMWECVRESETDGEWGGGWGVQGRFCLFITYSSPDERRAIINHHSRLHVRCFLMVQCAEFRHLVVRVAISLPSPAASEFASERPACVILACLIESVKYEATGRIVRSASWKCWTAAKQKAAAEDSCFLEFFSSVPSSFSSPKMGPSHPSFSSQRIDPHRA